MVYQRSALRHRSLPPSLRARGFPNTTPPAVPHEAAMDADLDRGVCARVACVGRDRSDSRLGHLETGEQVVQEPLKISIEQSLVAPDSALSCAFKN